MNHLTPMVMNYGNLYGTTYHTNYYGVNNGFTTINQPVGYYYYDATVSPTKSKSVDLYELQSKVALLESDLEKYKAIIDKLTKTADEQNKILNDIWYAPGMPGYMEAKETYDINTTINDNQ